MANEKLPAPESELLERAPKPKRKYKYIGPTFRVGVYLPDLATLINPITVSDADIDIYLNRFPKLRGQLWEELK